MEEPELHKMLRNWGKWASNATGTGYHCPLADYDQEANLTSDQIEEAFLVDKAVARTKTLNENYPFLLYQHFVRGKSAKTIHADWMGVYTKCKAMGGEGKKPPSVTVLKSQIEVAAAACGGYLLGLCDAA
ncbi:hypothetical protein [Vibrio sp. SCSIO 43136]|uniref:hypothetical protein n=1 Tax=Vibrio sp. SCSIO 43136 TaxID=2819101 RepID=UPI00207516C0|nr:hypothetical protein [Vibrio sp. SCSIO 43136]USD64226.1 hypothetical protein J4N39_08895 [Vibrio sp. SCSIO 43136]